MATADVSPARDKVLFHLKTRGPQTAAQVAERLGVTAMAIRQHLYALAGQGLAVVDQKEVPVKPGVVVDIPLGAVHRIGNTGDEKLVFIEVACGEQLTEDDIIRIQDDYARP